MTDEAAGSRGPATTGAEPSQDAPAPSPPTETPNDTPPGTPNDTPPGAQQPPPAAPPWFGAGATGSGAYFSREKLIRPHEGRHVAGVCAAIGRATNTDPVLWRVLIAVLGFFGIGVLLYLIGWLAIPGEGDTGSPIESLLGRGRSQMSPVSVIILAGVTALTFAFVLNDGLRTTLLAGAVLVGAFMLVKRNGAATAARGPGGDPVGAPGAATFPPSPAGCAPPPSAGVAAS